MGKQCAPAPAGASKIDRLYDRVLPYKYDPPSFALNLGHKDMRLARSWSAS